MTDAASVDLESFEKLPNDSLLFERMILKQTDNLYSSIQSILSKDHNMPTVIVIEAHNVSSNTIGRVYFADLGGWLLLEQQSHSQHSLERSLNYLLTVMIDLEQPSMVVEHEKYPLLAIFSEVLFKGHSRLVVLLDVVQEGSVRGLANGLVLGECLRLIRYCPDHVRPFDPNPDLINRLNDNLDQLEQERRSANQNARQLRKQLDTVTASKQSLEYHFSVLKSTSELERFEFEYALSCLELEAVALRDAIRDCHVKAVQAEQEACAHGLQSAELVELSVSRQRQLDSACGRLRQREQELGDQILLLQEQCSASSAALEAAQAESRRLFADVKSAHNHISSLNKEIEETAQQRADVQAKAAANSPVRRAQEREIGTLRRQLEQARATEEKLNSMLAKSDARAEAHRQVLADLERQLNELRRDNSKAHDDGKVSAALAKMETEWKAERQAMQRLLTDFKQTAINASASSSAKTEEYNGEQKKRPPPVVKKTISAPTKPEPSSEYEVNTAPKRTTTAPPKNTRKKQDQVPVASILAPPKPDIPAANVPLLSSLNPSTKSKPSTHSPVKLWKPASFLPNLNKRPNDTFVENAPLLANLSFGLSVADGERNAKRIKLPSRVDQPAGLQPASADSKQPSMFRSAAVSANPLAADPSLLPSIIANFNVKIPPKQKQ